MADECTTLQTKRDIIRERGKYLLYSGRWSDCTFLLGSGPTQEIVPSHKLILAMASPIFDIMFFRSFPDKSNRIPLLDVKPATFKIILEYFYTDNITLKSVQQACELYHGARKYNIPVIVDQCLKLLWSDASTSDACRIYEFAQQIDDKVLKAKSWQIICSNTLSVLLDPSFVDIQLNTLYDILDQDFLHINSELDLFDGITRHVEKQGTIPNRKNKNNLKPMNSIENHPRYRNAIKKIRFLTLNAREFAVGAARSKLLTQAESFAILMNVSSTAGIYPMPKGFTTCNLRRTYSGLNSNGRNRPINAS